MPTLNVECQICMSNAIEHVNSKDSSTIDCRICGNYEITGTASSIYLSRTNSLKANKLSHWIRKQFNGKNRVYIDSDKVDDIIENFELPKPKEQADNLIIYLGNQSITPDEVQLIYYDLLLSIIGAIRTNSVKYICKYLVDEGIINTFQDPTKQFFGHLTFKGWERYDELLHATTESRIAFMAMTFGNDKLNELYKDIIKPAVVKTGFDLKRLDDEPKAGIIDNLLRVEIRKAKFLIVDLTTDNRGAYWEAGFAEGLGKEVIYICEKTKFDDKENPVHFDTHHLQTVTFDWNELDEFVTQLKATIRATFPNDANMED